MITPSNLSQVNRFWVIANDGNLLPNPVQVSIVRVSVAERRDVIVDFSALWGKLTFGQFLYFDFFSFDDLYFADLSLSFAFNPAM